MDVLDDQWHHVSGTWDGTNTVRLFVDGVLRGTASLATPGNNTRPVNLGFWWGGGAPRRFFRGQLDEVAIHNRALNSNEIVAVYRAGAGGMCKPALKIVEEPQDVSTIAGANATFNVQVIGDLPLAYLWFKDSLPLANSVNISGVQSDVLSLSNLAPNDAGGYSVVVTNHSGSVTSAVARLTIRSLTDGLVAYYPFSGDARDATGHGNDGTVFGAQLAADREGHTDGAYSFNGASNYINCGTGPSVNANYLTNFTLAAWIWVSNDSGGYRPVLSKQTQTGGLNNKAEFDFQVQGNNNLNFFMGNGAGGYAVQVNGGVLQRERWYHVAVTVGSNTVVLYLDGQPKDTATYTAARRVFGTLPLQIGRFSNPGAQFFGGVIDEVRVYDWALPPQRIEDIMNAIPPELQAPVITAQPHSVTTNTGATVAFSVTATGLMPLMYQWLKEGAPLFGASSQNLLLANVQTNRSGGYSVIVTNNYGAVTSVVAQLTVLSPLTLAQALDTTNLTWTPGGAVSWFAQTNRTHDHEDAAQSGGITDSTNCWVRTSVLGQGLVSFWWRVSSETNYDGLVFAIGTNAVAAISGEVDWEPRTFAVPAGTNILTWYYLKDVSDPGGQDAGWLDQVSFVPGRAPQITAQPQPVTTNVGATVVFRVAATGTPPLFYQWLRDNAPLANSGNFGGATSTNLVLSNVQLADSGHSYSVIVSNVFQAVTSAPPALLTVNAAGGKPVILSQTLSVTTNVGATVGLEVTADGASPLTYQWFKGNQPIPMRTNRTCVFSPAQAVDQGSYFVELRNSQGTTRSAVIPLTLTALPEPRWQWVETGGGQGDDEALDLWVARAGHQLWVAGYVQPGAEMTGGGGRMASFGGSDTLLMRLDWDEGGMHFNPFTGGGSDDERAVATSRDATNFFWAGIFKSATFAPGNQTLTNQGGWDFFANAIGPNQQQWTLDVGTSGDEMCSGLAADQRGGVLVSGNLNEPAGAIFSWRESGFVTTNRGSWDVVAQKISAAGGNVNWLRLDGGSGGDIAFGLAADPQGNALLAGYTDSTNATFGAFALQNHGSGDGFVAKYRAADGVVEWAQSLGGSGSEAAYSVTTDGAGDVYVAGSFTSPSFTLGGILLANRGARNLFVAKLSGSDGAVLWARSFGGSGADIPNASALSVAFGAASQLFVAGTIASPDAHFGSFALNSANGGLFLAELDRTNGEPQWVTQASGQFNSLRIQADDFGNVYLAGSYQTNATFGPFIRPNRGGKDLFVACYGFSPPTIWEQPQRVVTNVSAVAQLSVRATSVLPMTYQWRTNGVPIPGATNSTLVIASAQANDTSLYEVVVSNPSGRTLSSNALVYVVADGIPHLQASQRPDVSVVEISYHLGGSSPCAVSLSASADGGVTWNVPVVSVSGDLGAAVKPGIGRQIQWNVGRDLPDREVSNLLVRVSACGFQTTSAPFTVNTVTVPSWKMRVWWDLNRNGRQDPGEQLGGAGIHYGGRTLAHFVDFVVDGDSLRVNQPLRFGATLFVRVWTSKQAIKPGHEAVNGRIFSVWFDSDLGPEDGAPGTGEWQSYMVTSADIARAAAGIPIDIQLRHVVFEWNLVVASEINSSAFLEKFKTGLESASRLLFDVTDGQMKLGQVAIYPGVTQTSSVWRNADAVIYARIEDQSLYQNGAIFWAWRGGAFSNGPEYHIYLGAHARGQPPDSLKYVYAFVHEFGHYAFGVLDEYLDGNGNQAAWQLYRQEHPELAPRDFGLMDAAGAYTPEMSSYNDYLPAYSGPIASNDVPSRAAVSYQLYNWWLTSSNRWAPCWQVLEYLFEHVGQSAGLNIVVPPYGHYLGGQKRSQSPRQGPYSIPAPYVPIEFTTVQPFSLIAAKSTDRLGDRAPQGPAQVHATWRGVPAIGAQVIRVPVAENRLIALGTTDRAGQLSVYDLAPGDVLVTRWRGMESRLTVLSPLDRSCPFEIALNDEPPDGIHATRDDPDPFGILVLPSVSGATNRLLSLALRTAGALIAPPNVKIYPDDAAGAVVTMDASAPYTYTGAVVVAEALGGTVELSCEPVASKRLAAADLFTITTVGATNDVLLRARDGWVEFHLDAGAVATDQPGLVYRATRPVFPPQGRRNSRLAPF